MNISVPHQLVGVFTNRVEKDRPNDRLSGHLKSFIYDILSTHPCLLFLPHGRAETLWKWLIKKDFYPVVKFIAQNATGGPRMIRWFMPSNQTYRYGETLLTDHALSLSPRMYELLVTMTGERLSNINEKTKESVLHILIGARDGEEILKCIVAKYGYDVDPNLIDVHGKSALNYALEEGRVGIARSLVEDLGADWQQPKQSREEDGVVFSNYTLAAPHLNCLEFLDSCMVNYRIFPNFSVKYDEEIEECMICVEDMPVGDRYFMNCCRQYVHSRCLSNNLARATEPVCMLCRADIRAHNTYLYDRTPNTIFKRRWEAEELEQTATNTPLPDDEVEEEISEAEEDEHVVPYEGSIDDDSLHLPPIVALPPLPSNPEDRPRYFIETFNALLENEQDFLEGRRHSMSAPNTPAMTMVVIPSFRSVGTMTTTLGGGISSLSSIGDINNLYNSFDDLRNLVIDRSASNERGPLVAYEEVLVYDQAAAF